MVTIHLDDDEHLLSVVAVVQAVAVDRIRQLVNNGAPIEVVRGIANVGMPALMWIELSAPQVRGLWIAGGQISREDPRYVPGMVESLNRISGLLESS